MTIDDSELEAHIKSCGNLMLQAFSRYEISSCFDDIADAHRWRMEMESAIKSRSPCQVAKMEQEMGIE